MYNKYPYTDAHELNLDWILEQIKALGAKIENFVNVNEIKVGGVWDITKDYESWTLVTNNNFGYISTKNVPAGTLLSDGNYWIMLFDYTQLFNTYETRLTAVETTTAEMEKIVLNNKKEVLLVGDSYGTMSPSWCSVLQSMMSDTTFHNLCVSGTGFDRSGVNGFLTQLQTYSGDKNEITDIIIAGGANDAENRNSGNYTSLRQAILDTFTYIKAEYPNAVIHVGFIGSCTCDGTYAATHNSTNLKWGLYAYKNACLIEGVHYLDNVEYVMHQNRALYNADGLHPSSSGSNLLGQAIMIAFTKTYKTYYALSQVNVNMVSPYTLDSGSVVYEIDSMFKLFTSQIILRNISSITGNTAIKIADINISGNVTIPVKIMLNNYNSITYQYIDAELIINGTELFIKSKQLKSDGSAYEDYTAGGSYLLAIMATDYICSIIDIN